MSHRGGRIDANQPAIVRKLKAIGASVQSLADVGDGCPDLLVGFRGETFVLEVKDGSKPPSKRALTEDQRVWHGRWRGQVDVVNNEDEAVKAIGAVVK